MKISELNLLSSQTIVFIQNKMNTNPNHLNRKIKEPLEQQFKVNIGKLDQEYCSFMLLQRIRLTTPWTTPLRLNTKLLSNSRMKAKIEVIYEKTCSNHFLIFYLCSILILKSRLSKIIYLHRMKCVICCFGELLIYNGMTQLIKSRIKNYERVFFRLFWMQFWYGSRFSRDGFTPEKIISFLILFTKQMWLV